MIISGAQVNCEGGATFAMKLFSSKKAIQTKEDATTKNDNAISLEKPEENPDLLTGSLKKGTRELTTRAAMPERHNPLKNYGAP